MLCSKSQSKFLTGIYKRFASEFRISKKDVKQYFFDTWYNFDMCIKIGFRVKNNKNTILHPFKRFDSKTVFSLFLDPKANLCIYRIFIKGSIQVLFTIE